MVHSGVISTIPFSGVLWPSLSRRRCDGKQIRFASVNEPATAAAKSWKMSSSSAILGLSPNNRIDGPPPINNAFGTTRSAAPRPILFSAMTTVKDRNDTFEPTVVTAICNTLIPERSTAGLLEGLPVADLAVEFSKLIFERWASHLIQRASCVLCFQISYAFKKPLKLPILW